MFVARPLACFAIALAVTACAGQHTSNTASATTKATTASTAAAATHATPRAVLDAFMQFYFHDYRTAVPTDAERAALRPLVTADFAAALDDVAGAERCAYARHHGTEPPLVQGDVFSSLFEKAGRVTGMDEVSNDGVRAVYRLHFEADAGGPTTRWDDDASLVRDPAAGWLIDDFIHRGQWDFAAKGSVKALLRATAATCKGG